MRAMNASSLHLWPGFHGFFKCQHSYNPSLKTVLKAWTCILQLKGKLPAFFSVCFVCSQIWRTWSCPCVIIQTLWSWHSLLTNVFLVELYFYRPAWTLQLPRHSFSWATAGSNSSNKPVDPPARFGQWSSRGEGGCSSYLDVSTPCPHHILLHMISPSTSVVLSLESSMNLRKGVENVWRSS